MRDFRQLEVWHKSHALALETYRDTARFPRDEQYGLTSQLRRSCASVPANIAEGCGRDSTRDFARFLTLALGSASETEYHFLLAADLGYLARESYEHLDMRIKEIKRMLTGLIRRIRSDDKNSES
jgi:four helix bundle protein